MLCDRRQAIILTNSELLLITHPGTNPHENENWIKILAHLPLMRIYAYESRVSIVSDNGLSPIRRQVIT